VLTSRRVVADFFEAVARLSQKPKEASNWIQNEVLRMVGDPEIGARSFDEVPLRPHDLASVLDLVGRGAIPGPAGRRLLREIARTGKSAKALVQELALEQVSDAAQIERWCREALVGREKIVEDVRAGKPNAINALLGPVLKLSGGKASAQVVRETLLRIVQDGA
jgi:aspartyl-tRNA(Asn)/glutamyl-tRNA(Gln) amidotransferase subunit B